MTKPNDTGDRRRYGDRGAMVASFAAVASMLAASSCCLPILPFVVAAGFAGGSAFLFSARPYLLIASVLFIGYGFYHARGAKKCHRGTRVIANAVLWLSTAFVLISILFPQMLANAAANMLAR
jgi:hypothetical protein